jgi:hypothetical protein
MERGASLLQSMPLEGHWERTTTPLYKLTRRERLVAFGALVVTIVAVAAIVIVTAANTRAAPGPGCIRALTPNVMGAEELNACGARARHLCAKFATDDDPVGNAVEASCRDAGIR